MFTPGELPAGLALIFPRDFRLELPVLDLSDVPDVRSVDDVPVTSDVQLRADTDVRELELTVLPPRSPFPPPPPLAPRPTSREADTRVVAVPFVKTFSPTNPLGAPGKLADSGDAGFDDDEDDDDVEEGDVGEFP